MECGEGSFVGGLAPWRTLGLAMPFQEKEATFMLWKTSYLASMEPAPLQPTASEAFSAVAHGEEETWK